MTHSGKIFMIRFQKSFIGKNHRTMKDLKINLIKIGLSTLSICCLIVYIIFNLFGRNATTYKLSLEEIIVWIAIFWLMLGQILSITRYLKAIYKRKQI